MYAIGTDLPRQMFVAVDQDNAPERMRALCDLCSERLARRSFEFSFPYLHQTQPLRKRVVKLCERALDPRFPGMGDGVNDGQRQCFQYRRIGRKHRRDR